MLGEDFISKIYDKIKEADGVIFASPVFFCDVSAQCKAVMDRSLGLIPMGAGKTSASVITCGSVGANSAPPHHTGLLQYARILRCGLGSYLRQDPRQGKGKEVAYNLGRKMVQTSAILKKAMEEAKASGDETLLKDMAHHNHFAYGTHTF